MWNRPFDVLQSVEAKVWEEGFDAGQVFQTPCPYEIGTLEEADWLDGWLEGSAKALGWPYVHGRLGQPAQSHPDTRTYQKGC